MDLNENTLNMIEALIEEALSFEKDDDKSGKYLHRASKLLNKDDGWVKNKLKEKTLSSRVGSKIKDPSTAKEVIKDYSKFTKSGSNSEAQTKAAKLRNRG